MKYLISLLALVPVLACTLTTPPPASLGAAVAAPPSTPPPSGGSKPRPPVRRPQEPLYTVAAHALNVHADPCVSCRGNIVDWLKQGDTVTVLDTAVTADDIRIAYIRYNGGRLGYVALRFLNPLK